jgi:glycosyltransferase involved in cell wall biosynthesis
VVAPLARCAVAMVARLVVKLGRMAAFWSSLVFRGKRNAGLLLVANERSRQSLPRTLHKVPCELMVENGVQTELWKPCRDTDEHSRNHQVTRLITIGRLVDCKAIDQLLHAIAGLENSLVVHLDVIGDGPQRNTLEELSERLGLGDRVIFHGFLSQETCCRHLEEADIFLLPSLHECGGAAVLESMACGVPVIAANWGGPADYLTGDGANGNYGVLVEPTEGYVLGLQEAIVELASDVEKRRHLVDTARQRVHEAFDWNVKGREMLEVYERVTSTKRERVDP